MNSLSDGSLSDGSVSLGEISAKTRTLDLESFHLSCSSWLWLDPLRSLLVHDNKTVSSAERRRFIFFPVCEGAHIQFLKSSVRPLRYKFIRKDWRRKPNATWSHAGCDLDPVYWVTIPASSHLHHGLECGHLAKALRAEECENCFIALHSFGL